jgi:hypothetical protein
VNQRRDGNNSVTSTAMGQCALDNINLTTVTYLNVFMFRIISVLRLIFGAGFFL